MKNENTKKFEERSFPEATEATEATEKGLFSSSEQKSKSHKKKRGGKKIIKNLSVYDMTYRQFFSFHSVWQGLQRQCVAEVCGFTCVWM